MKKDGSVMIIEDDVDDQKFLEHVFEKLGYTNKLHFFDNGVDALEFLDNSDVIPFIILSDINMPKLDGFALRDRIRINTKLQLRSVPFIFFSTSADEDSVITAYSLSVQGFFKKQIKISEMEKTIEVIMEYWLRCVAPNNF
ncbi:MAG: response regulator [Ferruginibacter sp.]|nr:response regulator [Ferruginibacter sp.]